jgi:alkylation response protein AidB-like acyl-CoA dehydrogenase
MRPEIGSPHVAYHRVFDEHCAARIAPWAGEVDRRGAVPRASFRELAEAGYLGLFHPLEQGGSGADGPTLAAAMESLARSCASTFWAASISTLLAGKMLHVLTGPRQHRAWLRPIVRGEKIGCFAASEDGAGCDPGSYRAVVRTTARGVTISGRKSRISNAGVADVAVVLARTDHEDSAGLCYAVVDLSSPGVRRREHGKMGLHGMSWGTIELDDVALDPDDVIHGASIEQTLGVVEWGQVLQIFSSLGLAEAALRATCDRARSRSAFGRPLADLDIVHARLADMRAEIGAARLLAHHAVTRKARGLPAREAVMMAKIYTTEMAVRAADLALRTFGGWGYTKEHPIERIYRDALANVAAGLPTDRLRELLVCPLVGADPFRYAPFDWAAAAGGAF